MFYRFWAGLAVGVAAVLLLTWAFTSVAGLLTPW